MSLSRTKLVSSLMSTSLPSELNYDWSSFAPKEKKCTLKCWFKACNYIIIIVIWIGSSTGIVLSVLSRMRLQSMEPSFSHTPLDPPLACIALSFLTFFLSVTAFSALIRKSTTLLYTVCASCAILFIVHITLSVYTYHYIEQGPAVIPSLMRDTLLSYTGGDGEENSLDYAQQKFSCCGVITYSDWTLNSLYSCDSTQEKYTSAVANRLCGVPASCCQHITHPSCGHHINPLPFSEIQKLINIDGCAEAVQMEYRTNYIHIATLSLCNGFALAVCLLLSHTTIREIQIASYKERKEQKMRMQVHKIYDET